MRITFSLLLIVLSATAAQSQIYKEGTLIPVPANTEFQIDEDDLRYGKHVFTRGQVCVSDKDDDTLSFVSNTAHSVTAYFKRGATSRGERLCPNNARVVFPRTKLGEMLRAADQNFSRSIFNQK